MMMSFELLPATRQADAEFHRFRQRFAASADAASGCRHAATPCRRLIRRHLLSPFSIRQTAAADAS